MQKSMGQPELKYLLLVCAIGVGFIFAPASAVQTVNSLFLDAAAPGQELTVQLIEQGRQATKNFEPASKRNEDVARLQQEIELLQQTTRQLQSQNLVLQQEVNTNQLHGTSAYQTNASQPLLETSLVEARVLGEESNQLWRSGKLLNRGEKQQVSESAMVLNSPHSLLDLGADFNLHPGQSIFAGRCVVGKISQVGKWSSTLLPISDKRYHGGLVQLIRFTNDGPVVVAVGKIQGEGDNQCRVTAVESTAAVQTSDSVYTRSSDELIPAPMLFGKVTQAKLVPGASEWDILLEPALDITGIEKVQILNRTLNPSRMLAN